MNQFTRGIAIRANAILPGLMDTPRIHQQISAFHGAPEEMAAARHAASPTGRRGNAWDVAHAAVFLASEEAKHINGIEPLVDGGLHVKAG